jgi:predicted enzyme related to lactoylglutathione lyase
MFNYNKTFSSFSVNDLDKAQVFYEKTLGLPVDASKMGLRISLPANEIFIYGKPNHEPATFTVLNFQVGDIEAAVSQLTGQGIKFLQYGGDIQTDSKGIARPPYGPTIAWFADPSGNILSVLQERANG